MKFLIWTVGGSYRVIDSDNATLAVVAGGRLWSLSEDLAVDGPVATVARSGNKTWFDPMIGIAGGVKLGNGFGLRAQGDYGGFGAGAEHDWQIDGTLGYQIEPRRRGGSGLPLHEGQLR